MGTKRVGTARLRVLIQQITAETLIKFNILPSTNGGAELGSASSRFANIYCQDLNLANERGDYTIIEEEEHLSIRNNKNGKLYKLLMEEIEEEEK